MAIGRPLEFDPDTALDAAMQVFWCKGYDSSSLQDLLSAMKLSKSSFYQTFKSKQALFQRCMLYYRQSLAQDMQVQLMRTGSGRAFIETLFRDIAAETIGVNARRGCLLMNTASEFAQRDTEIAGLVAESIEQLTTMLESVIKEGQQQGDISAAKDARTLATYLVSSISGLKNMVKAGADKETTRRIADTILTTLD